MPAGQGTYRGTSKGYADAKYRSNMRSDMMKKAGIKQGSDAGRSIITSSSALKDAFTMADTDYRRHVREMGAMSERAHLTPYKPKRERGRSSK
jgi:hypothetical protein